METFFDKKNISFFIISQKIQFTNLFLYDILSDVNNLKGGIVMAIAIIISAIVVASMLFTYSLCRVSADADDFFGSR